MQPYANVCKMNQMTASQKAAALLLCLSITPACNNNTTPAEPPVTTSPLEKDIARFAPVDIGVDLSGLPANERDALNAMVDAGRIIDGIYLQQVWSENPALLVRLAADRSPEGQRLLHYFLINKGPWSRLDEDSPFVPGVGP